MSEFPAPSTHSAHTSAQLPPAFVAPSTPQLPSLPPQSPYVGATPQWAGIPPQSPAVYPYGVSPLLYGGLTPALGHTPALSELRFTPQVRQTPLGTPQPTPLLPYISTPNVVHGAHQSLSQQMAPPQNSHLPSSLAAGAGAFGMGGGGGSMEMLGGSMETGDSHFSDAPIPSRGSSSSASGLKRTSSGRVPQPMLSASWESNPELSNVTSMAAPELPTRQGSEEEEAEPHFGDDFEMKEEKENGRPQSHSHSGSDQQRPAEADAAAQTFGHSGNNIVEQLGYLRIPPKDGVVSNYPASITCPTATKGSPASLTLLLSLFSAGEAKFVWGRTSFHYMEANGANKTFVVEDKTLVRDLQLPMKVSSANRLFSSHNRKKLSRVEVELFETDRLAASLSIEPCKRDKQFRAFACALDMASKGFVVLQSFTNVAMKKSKEVKGTDTKMRTLEVLLKTSPDYTLQLRYSGSEQSDKAENVSLFDVEDSVTQLKLHT